MSRDANRVRELAHAAGFTRHVEASCTFHDLVGWIRPDCDLDGAVEVITDDGDRLSLNGWLWSIEPTGDTAGNASNDGEV